MIRSCVLRYFSLLLVVTLLTQVVRPSSSSLAWAVPEGPVSPQIPDEILEIVRKLQRCAELPKCDAPTSTPGPVVGGGYRTAAHPCQLTVEEEQALVAYFQGINLNQASVTLLFAFYPILAAISVAVGVPEGDLNGSNIATFIGVSLGLYTILVSTLDPIYHRASRLHSISPALNDAGVDPALVGREVTRISRNSWLRNLGRAIGRRVSARRGVGTLSSSNPAPNPSANLGTGASAGGSSEPRTQTRINAFGNDPNCVPESTIDAVAANAVEGLRQLELAEAEVGAAGSDAAEGAEGRGRGVRRVARRHRTQAVEAESTSNSAPVGTPVVGSAGAIRPAARSATVPVATSNQVCSVGRVQQYAQSLATDRAQRFRAFQRRQQREIDIITRQDRERFEQAQRADLIQGGTAVAGAIVGGVLLCSSGGTAAPLLTIGNQLLGRATASATAVIAVASGAVTLAPFEALAESSGSEAGSTSAPQHCALTAPRVVLPRAASGRLRPDAQTVTRGAEAYVSIPASAASERLSPVASYDPSRTPMCWAPAAATCAALRRSYAAQNITGLLPSVCATAAQAPGTNNSSSTPAPPTSPAAAPASAVDVGGAG